MFSLWKWSDVNQRSNLFCAASKKIPLVSCQVNTISDSFYKNKSAVTVKFSYGGHKL